MYIYISLFSSYCIENVTWFTCKVFTKLIFALETEEKATTENKPFALTGDFFPKIIVRHDIHKRWYDENGVLNIGVIDFLLDDTLV